MKDDQDEIIWLSFELFKNWPYFNGYAYDQITDDEITYILKNGDEREIIDQVNLKRGWQSSMINDKERHIHRIAVKTRVPQPN